jgi:hypothetical protein
MNENEDEKFGGHGFYNLPEYSRLLTFPNFKSKLAKKLKIKQDSLITKKSIEENSDKKCNQYIDFLNCEIALIQYLLDSKDIKDDV